MSGTKRDNSDWLFDGDNADAPEPAINVNEQYAERYSTKKRDQRIQLLEAEVEALEESLASEEEREDELGELVTDRVASEFLDVYNLVRRRDPVLYEPGKSFFGGTAAKPTPVQEQAALKRELLAAAHGSDGSSDQEGDGEALLKPVEKSAEELRREAEEYKEFLARTKADKVQRGQMDDFWAAPAANLDENERFLRDFILGNGWVDEAGVGPLAEADLAALSESEEALERADEFEHKWNFRHEEPGAVGPQSYPRDMPSVRAPKVSARKAARVRSAEQKRAEKDRLADELKRLKADKRRELDEKMRHGERELAEVEDDELRARMAQMKEDELQQFLDDYLKLDYEDVVGGVKARFQYDEVKPNAFGLRAEELVELDDALLEEFVPIKALAPHRASEWKPSHKKLKWVKGKVEGEGKKSSRRADKEGKKDKSSKKEGKKDKSSKESSGRADAKKEDKKHKRDKKRHKSEDV